MQVYIELCNRIPLQNPRELINVSCLLGKSFFPNMGLQKQSSYLIYEIQWLINCFRLFQEKNHIHHCNMNCAPPELAARQKPKNRHKIKEIILLTFRQLDLLKLIPIFFLHNARRYLSIFYTLSLLYLVIPSNSFIYLFIRLSIRLF